MFFITIWAYIFVPDHANGCHCSCILALHVQGLCHFPLSAALLEIWLDFDLSTQLPTTSASQLQNAVLVLKDMRIKELWYEWWQRTECALIVIFCISSCFHSHLRKTGFNREKTFFPKFLHFAQFWLYHKTFILIFCLKCFIWIHYFFMNP